jgi:hypothetical protein
MTKKQFIQEWEQITLTKIFEFEVLNKKTQETDYVTFEIFIEGNRFKAWHESTTKKEAKSKKIAYVQIKIDFDFSIDRNLQELYEECTCKIIDSEFFELI